MLAISCNGTSISVVPAVHPVREVVRSSTTTVTIAYTTIIVLILSCVVSIEKNLRVTIIRTIESIKESRLKTISRRIVDCFYCCVISLLEIILSLACITCALWVCWDVVWVLKPPSVCEVSLSKEQTCCCLCYGTCHTRLVRESLNSINQVIEDCLINLWYGITLTFTVWRIIELKFTSTEIQWYAAKSLNKLKVI